MKKSSQSGYEAEEAVEIINMQKLDHSMLDQSAAILNRSIPLGWPTLEEARQEIRDRLVAGNTLLAAVKGNKVLGWGGILEPIYDGRVFELHPLAVDQQVRGRGIGRSLVTALEDEARRQGGLTMYLGADDESAEGETSLAKADLYEDLPGKLQNFLPSTHQSAFYLKLGYTIIGVMPDANGPGKPDIFLGKKL